MKYDLLVIGGGSGGVRAARMASQLGNKVALVDYQALGGTCVNVGCIPKKLFVYASHFAENFEEARGYGWRLPSSDFYWSGLIANKDREISRLNNVYENLLKNSGVEVIQGKAHFLNENTIDVNGITYQAKRILVATGAKSFVPDIKGKEFIKTSNDMFFLEKLPESLLIIGGGYIALEFAGIMNGLGVKTELAYRGELPLRGFDEGARKHLLKEMAKKGVHFRFNTEVKSIEKVQNGLLVNCNTNDACVFDEVLFATGRMPETEELALENAGVKTDERGAIIVNERFESSVPGIFALGDVINRMQLTPVAIKEAMVFVNQQFANSSLLMNYECVPSAVFSQPEFASVGLSEEEAEKKGVKFSVFESEFKALKHTLGESTERTYLKLIVEEPSQKVLGAHMVGGNAAEIIQGLAIAIKAGATKQDFDETIGIHPTSAEEFVSMRNPRQ